MKYTGIPVFRGRPAGAQNRIPAEIKDLIRGALEEAGGQDYLVRQANANPVAFLGLLGKIIPQEVKSHLDINMRVHLAKKLDEAFQVIDNKIPLISHE